MLYTGNTLREALGKALGTRDQYGRKIERRTYGKQDTQSNPFAAQAAIARAREEAVAWAENYMTVQRTYGNGHEFGCYATYNEETGETVKYPRNVAGFGGGSHYRFSYRPSQGILLVTGHSHPRESDADPHGSSDETNEQNTVLTEEQLDEADSDLLDHAPVVIKLPSNRGSQVTVLWGTWRGR